MSNKPVIALVGRPNVGKSTLFNRLSRSRDALVADLAGLTRDRKYGEGTFDGKSFIVIDTGGISGAEQGIDVPMAAQSYTAMGEADVVLFIVDAREGLTAADHLIAGELRSRGKKTFLVVNKTDGLREDLAEIDFFELGFADILPISASQNRGIRSLLEKVLEPFAEQQEEAPGEQGILIGIIGRPNVGKSTLVNRLLGEERVIVFDQPGTTRDSIFIPYERHGRPYTLIDTAGVRRRKNVEETVEKFSIVKTLQAIKDAHVVILVMDAREGIVDQDLHLLGFAMEAGRAIVIAINKWDGMTPDARQQVKSDIERRLGFADYARLHLISALHGTGVGDLYASIEECYAAAMRKWPTRLLTDTLQAATGSHPPPLVNGRRIKLRMAHQGGSNPPIIVIHGNQTAELPKSYKRYLENTFREALEVKGTPIRFEFRSGENPFADKVNRLTPRQVHKRERLVRHVKKLKHREKRRKSR